MTQLVANLAPLGSLVGEVASMKQVVERLLFSDERAGEEEFPRTLAKLY